MAKKTATTASTQPQTQLQRGIAIIRAYAKNLPNRPGIYQMRSSDDSVLYIGKAKNLPKRVMSYTQTSRLPLRLQRMVAATAMMHHLETSSETEALLLEASLIKQHQPRYNVLLKDDKMFPSVLIAGGHEFPQLLKHRGARQRDGYYYGPFVGVGSIDQLITNLQRAFLLRNCSDAVFAARKRPCLQYHIKRCTAPCVGLVGAEDYGQQVAQARRFLDGKSLELQVELAEKMQAASDALNFETAASYRDRIRALSAVQARQSIFLSQSYNADIFALVHQAGRSAVQLVLFRSGRHHGSHVFFPTHDPDTPPGAIMAGFLLQFYQQHPIPEEIWLNLSPDDDRLLAEALSKMAGRRVQLLTPQRGEKADALNQAVKNASSALQQELAASAAAAEQMLALSQLLGMEHAPERIEIFDNSHISGVAAVGAMVVATPRGFDKNSYRKFNFTAPMQGGDDYAMMREMLSRRAKRFDEIPPAQLMIIDGGKGQLAVAKQVLHDYAGTLIAIAKGADRHAGREVIHLSNGQELRLPPNSPALYLLQRWRDEAHRFAIGSHRAKRQKNMGQNPLDAIAGIGASRKKALLQYFGSAKAVARAAVADLQRVPGISAAIALKIHQHFNP